MDFQKITYIGVLGDSITITSKNTDFDKTIHNGLRCVIETLKSKGYPDRFNDMSIYLKKNVNTPTMYFDKDEHIYINKLFNDYMLQNTLDVDTIKYIENYLETIKKINMEVTSSKKSSVTQPTMSEERKQTLNM